MSVIGDCEICHEPIVTEDDLPDSDIYCGECLAWWQWWTSLTLEQQREERAMWDAYGAEAADRRFDLGHPGKRP